MILGADVGGTFTDLVLVVDGEVTTAKIPTSRRQEDAISEGIEELAGESHIARRMPSLKGRGVVPPS
jgi:N-methylhydantoinase A